MSTATLASVGYPQPPLSVSPGSPAMSAMSGPSAADSRNAPSFKEFSRNLQKKKILPVEEPPPLSLPRASPDFRSVSYDSTRLDRSISPRTTDTVDRSLMPAPLSIYKKRDTVIEDQPNVSRYQFPEHEEGSTSRFSTTSSEDSYVIYTGVTQSVRAYVRHKMQKKRDNPKKERKRVMSVASAKYPGMLTAKEYDRRHSSGSRRPSLQQGISSVYKRLSRLSIAGPSGQDQDKKSPRGRQKQLAIPTSAYQKYGAAVWEAPKRQKKAQRSSAPMKTLVKKTNSGRAKRHPSMPGNPTEVAQAFKSGRSQIIQAFGGTKHKLMRSKSEKRREALKQSIRLVGPADLISDGAKNYTV